MTAAPRETGGSAYNVERFRARNEAFLFAAVKEDTASLVYLEQGTASTKRSHAREQLRCPEHGCVSPEITTVNRASGGRRDGYRHLTRPRDTVHAPESVLHRQGKALLVRWASMHPAVADAQMEVRVGNGERTADVLLTSRSGNRMAIEIQFAGISVEEWTERTESYATLDIPVVWLFGNCGACSPQTGALRLVHKQVVRRDWPLMWINPTDEVVGWLAHRREQRLVSMDNPGDGVLRFGTLDDLELRATGLFPPGFLAARKQTVADRESAQKAEDERRAQRQPRAAARWTRQETRAFGPPYIAHGSARAGPDRPRCRRCGLPVDPDLKSGVHVDDCLRVDPPTW